MTPQAYWTLLEPFADRLKQIPHRAWADLVAWVPESERAGMFEIPRAGFIQWRMIVHAQNEFGTNGAVRVVGDGDGLFFLFIENGQDPVGVEFGKAGETLCRRKNSNAKNRAMLGQTCFSFFENAPFRFNLVYTLSGFGISAQIERIAITVESDEGVEWRTILYDRSDEISELETLTITEPQGAEPPAPKVLPKTPATDGDEEEIQKHAG